MGGRWESPASGQTLLKDPEEDVGWQTAHARERVMSQIELPSREREWCWMWRVWKRRRYPSPLWQAVERFFSLSTSELGGKNWGYLKRAQMWNVTSLGPLKTAPCPHFSQSCWSPPTPNWFLSQWLLPPPPPPNMCGSVAWILRPKLPRYR